VSQVSAEMRGGVARVEKELFERVTCGRAVGTPSAFEVRRLTVEDGEEGGGIREDGGRNLGTEGDCEGGGFDGANGLASHAS
jgi:hypothetical protein